MQFWSKRRKTKDDQQVQCKPKRIKPNKLLWRNYQSVKLLYYIICKPFLNWQFWVTYQGIFQQQVLLIWLKTLKLTLTYPSPFFIFLFASSLVFPITDEKDHKWFNLVLKILLMNKILLPLPLHQKFSLIRFANKVHLLLKPIRHKPCKKKY